MKISGFNKCFVSGNLSIIFTRFVMLTMELFYFKNQKLKISVLKKVTFSEILICNLVYALFYKSKKNNWQIAVGKWKSETNNNKVFINHRITEISNDKLLLQKENENTALVFNL